MRFRVTVPGQAPVIVKQSRTVDSVLHALRRHPYVSAYMATNGYRERLDPDGGYARIESLGGFTVAHATRLDR